jgi:hypothetical protein
MFNKCARTFASQFEALKKYRSTGEQSIKVRHVNVHDGRQAIVSSTLQTGEGEMEKAMINRMNPVHRLQQAPRCSATSKRTRQPCRAPAVRDWTLRRCHGARGGALIGKRNGRYRHGRFTKAAPGGAPLNLQAGARGESEHCPLGLIDGGTVLMVDRNKAHRVG